MNTLKPNGRLELYLTVALVATIIALVVESIVAHDNDATAQSLRGIALLLVGALAGAKAKG